MHVLALTHYYPPEVNAPASRTVRNAARLERSGDPGHRRHLRAQPSRRSSIPAIATACGRKSGRRHPVIRIWTFSPRMRVSSPRIANYLIYLFSLLFGPAAVAEGGHGDVDHRRNSSAAWPGCCSAPAAALGARNPRSVAGEHRHRRRDEARLARSACSNGWSAFAYRSADPIVSVTDASCHTFGAPRPGPDRGDQERRRPVLLRQHDRADAGAAFRARVRPDREVRRDLCRHPRHGARADTVIAAAERLRDDERSPS